MKPQLYPLLALIALSPLAHAEWAPLESFEGQSTSVHSIEDWSELAVIEADPEDPANRVLTTTPMVFDAPLPYGAIALPVALDDDSHATIYLRVYSTAVDQEPVTDSLRIGLTDVPVGQIPTRAVENVFRGGVSISGADETPFYLRPVSVEGISEPLPPTGEWIEVWLHIDQPTDTFQVYIKSPTHETPRLLMVDLPDEEPQDQFPFHQPTTQDLVTLLIDYGMAGGPNPILLDDFALDPSGFNLLSPPKWGPWIRSGEREDFVGTVDWLGWLHLSGDYVYSYRLEQYLFMPSDYVTTEGAWGYIVR